MVTFTQKGDWSKTTKWLERAKGIVHQSTLDKYGKEGVALLKQATPTDTGKTAESWRYKTTITNRYARLDFINDNVEEGVPIAILIQYGHATKNGGFVTGFDFINPSVRPLFNDLAENVWKEVTKD